MIKNKKGFTLIELIVVIAIVGILAGILVPNLVGYINKAEKAAAEQEITPYISAYQSWVLEKDRLGYNVDANVFTKTKDSKVVQNKTYFSERNGDYTAINSPITDNISTYYERTETKKTFSEYCAEEIGINIQGDLEVDGTAASSTGFIYTSKNGNYTIKYRAVDGNIETVKK